MRVLALLLSSLVLAPALATAHHFDTPLQAEASAPDPVVLYRQYARLRGELDELAAAHPALFKFEVIGHSVLGLEIYGIHVTNFASQEPPMEERERLYFDGSIHSNEQLGMEVTMDIVRWLVKEYESDPTAHWVVDNRQVFAVPMVNPDGNVKDSRKNAHEVDVNRNFPVGWGDQDGASNVIAQGTYHGPSAASEPETQAIVGFLTKVRPQYVDSFHTGTRMLLFPWGTWKKHTPDHALFTSICHEIQEDMDEANGGEKVPCGQAYTTIYPASGTTVDFAYERLGAVAFTFEVDDEQFIPASPQEIRERLAEAWVSVEHALLNVERYGAWINVSLAAHKVEGGKVREVEFDMANQGLGASANLTLATNLPAADEAVDLAPAESFAVSASGLALGRGDRVVISVTYLKTRHRGFEETRTFTYEVTDSPGGLGLKLVPNAKAEPKALPSGGVPGFEALLLAVASVALVRTLRRR